MQRGLFPAFEEQVLEDRLDSQIVRGGDGVITAAWPRRVPGGYSELWAGRYTPGAGWQTPVMLGSGYDQRTPVMASGPGGHVVLVWQSTLTEGSHQLMRAVRFTPGGGWGPVTEIQGATASYVRDADVGMDAAGNAIVVWTQGAANVASAWARRQRADGAWEPAVLLEHEDATADPNDPTSIDWHHVYFPQVAVDAAGNATAAWWQAGLDDHFAVWSARYTAAGGWTERVAVPGGDRGYDLTMAADPAGVVHMLWHVNPQTGTEVLRASRYVAGAWTPSVVVDADADAAPAEVSLAIGADGAAMATWAEGSAGGAHALFAARYTTATGWGAVEAIGQGGRYYPFPEAGIDAAGAAHVAWVQTTPDGIRHDVRARRWLPGTGWAPEVAVETDDTVSASEPELVVIPDGSAVAMWMMSDGIPEMTSRRTLWVGVYR
jgi:hypothetical protein